ncbi:MAG: hypothetical protein GY757_07035, partial [bacterium]|nr:hypothetical protein [bacterium]
MNKKKLNGKMALLANQRVKERDYWLKQLEGDWDKTHFPYDNKATTAETDEHHQKTEDPVKIERVTFRINRETVSAIQKISRGNDYALHTIATAALVALLNKYTGENDIVVGTPIYKQKSDSELINNMLILRSNLNESITFKELLIQVKETLAQAVEHQNYPLEVLAQQLERPYTPRQEAPLQETALLLKNIQPETYLPEAPNSTVFILEKKEDAVEGAVHYNPRRYRQDTIRRIAAHYTRLLQKAAGEVNIAL